MEGTAAEATLPPIEPLDNNNAAGGGQVGDGVPLEGQGLPQPPPALEGPREGAPASDSPPAPPLEVAAPDAQASAPTKSIEDAKEFIKQVRGLNPGGLPGAFSPWGVPCGKRGGHPAPPSPPP